METRIHHHEIAAMEMAIFRLAGCFFQQYDAYFDTGLEETVSDSPVCIF